MKILMKQLECSSKYELMQKLLDPPKKFKPSTNMNDSGKMTALRMTYKNKNHTETNGKRIQSAYHGSRKDKKVLNAHIKQNTYINFPN